MYEISLDPEDRTAVFDLALKDDSDDGGLLDWEAYAGVPLCCAQPSMLLRSGIRSYKALVNLVH